VSEILCIKTPFFLREVSNKKLPKSPNALLMSSFHDFAACAAKEKSVVYFTT